MEALSEYGPALGFLLLVCFIAALGWFASRMRKGNDETWARVASRHGLVAEPGLTLGGTVDGRKVSVKGWYKRVRGHALPHTVVSVTLRRSPADPQAAAQRAAQSGHQLNGDVLLRDYRGFLTREQDLDDALGLALTLARVLDEGPAAAPPA